MIRARAVARSLRASGITFFAALALFLICWSTGQGLLAFLDSLILVVSGAIVVFRLLRYLARDSLWSLRNRLLVVYALIGVLPILLLFALVGAGAWALLDELAIYLANAELNRRVESLKGAIDSFLRVPPQFRKYAVPEIQQSLRLVLPDVVFYVDGPQGQQRYPSNAPPLNISPKWGNVNGLLVMNGRFYAWAHFNTRGEHVSAIAPLTDATVENLVPRLGAIALIDTHETKGQQVEVASVGTLRASRTNTGPNPDFRREVEHVSLPQPVNRFDIPLSWFATLSHYSLEAPNKAYGCVLWVYSRPSAVLRNYFSSSESLRGVLFDAVVALAILFFLVELVAIFIGVSLSRRIITAVNQLYEGTRRVNHGDFSHRIPVRAHDQIGELAESFNQMTGNLQRLLAIEKEKERLQTEIEIAREVQSQLYPKQAPPMCGLKLTVRCDPARIVSGDYYDYQTLSNSQLAFAIGDVAGKGISAALLMATLQASLRAQISWYQPYSDGNRSRLERAEGFSVATLVSLLNKQLYELTSPEKYATFFFGFFDETTRTLQYTNAGHLPPLLFRDGEVMRLDSNGMIIGAFPWASYGEGYLRLKPGDLLVCYTDGITEPENAYGEMFGQERLIELIQKHIQEEDQEIIRIVLDTVRGWSGGPELHDDMTLLLAREVESA